jgi:hypothetical protein
MKTQRPHTVVGTVWGHAFALNITNNDPRKSKLMTEPITNKATAHEHNDR